MTVIDQPAFDLSCFAADHVEARSKFLGAAESAGALLAQYENPCKGPHGEELFLDTAWLGSKDARKVLVTVSGTHGPEGFCGSACQVDLLSKFGAPERLADRDVFVMPGRIMGSPDYFRISLTASDAMIERALPAFREFAAIVPAER